MNCHVTTETATHTNCQVFSDRIAVMQQGLIVEQGPKDEILRNPTQEYTKRLIAAVPVPDPDQQAKRRSDRKK